MIEIVEWLGGILFFIAVCGIALNWYWAGKDDDWEHHR